MREEGLTVSAFARKIGIGDQTVRSVCVLRRNKPGFDFISKLVQTYEWINPSWLLTGQGDMKREPGSMQSSISLKELVDYLRERDKKIEGLTAENAVLKYERDCLRRQ